MTISAFYDRADQCYFVPNADAAAAYCKEHCAEEIAHIMRVADEVCRNYFVFDLNWDMERTYDPVEFTNEIDWSIQPKGDPEFVWQFNRHRFFICLGQAYKLSGDERYAQAFVRLAEDWMARVPLCAETENGPWRMLETGLRGETWTKALRYMKDSACITDDFLERFADCLCKHAERLVEHGGDARVQSNWCVLENTGLFEIALGLPKQARTEAWIETALSRIAQAVSIQVYSDGSQWEQSPMYHNEVYHCLCSCIYLAHANGIALPAGLEARVHEMALADLKWMKPDRHQFTHGDSDDTDLRDVLSMGAYLFADGRLKYVSTPHLDFESAWDFGQDAWEAYEALEAYAPAFTSTALTDSGNYYLRESWEENANLLHFTCGAMSTGHCHGDKLHVSLVLNGEDVLIDGGRATYMNVPLRFALKDNAGHNTTTVDENAFTTFSDSWFTERLSLPVNRAYHQGELAEYVQGGHLGYMREGVYVNRQCIWIKPDIYIINDTFYGAGNHTYRQYFHFSPDGSAQICDRNEMYACCGQAPSEAKTGEKAENSHIVFSGKNNRAYFSFLTEGCTLTKEASVCSRHYNQSEPNDCVCAVCEKEGFASMIAVVNGGNREAVPVHARLIEARSHTRGCVLSEREAQAIYIDAGARKYVVIICHDEVFHGSDAVLAGNCLAGGNVTVFDVTRQGEERLYGGEVLHA